MKRQWQLVTLEIISGETLVQEPRHQDTIVQGTKCTKGNSSKASGYQTCKRVHHSIADETGEPETDKNVDVGIMGKNDSFIQGPKLNDFHNSIHRLSISP